MILKRNWYYLFFLWLFIIGCKPTSKQDVPDDWHLLDLGQFKIYTPSTWSYEDPGKQEDSFIGQIKGPNVMLSFDCSDMGYANHLLLKEEDTLNKYSIVSDSTQEYVIKSIRPKIPGHGMTGIYIRSRKSSFNFQMNGQDLSAKDQADALKAFKTITFKK